MNKTLLLLSLFAAGCVPDFGSSNLGLATIGVASSSVAACRFDGGDLPGPLSDAIVLDLAISHTLRFPVLVRNEWDVPVAVKSMDLRWECNATGFTNTPSLIVPAYSLQDPFCLDTLSGGGNFVGFDIIDATSAPVLPGETRVAWAEVVPRALGDGILQTIDLAIAASRCRDADDCAGYQAILTDLGVSPPIDPTLRDQFASFASMDGTFGLEEMSSPPVLGSGYQMQLHGVVRAETDDGDPVYSNEVIHTVEFCRNCGALIGPPPGRAPRGGFECYYDQSVPR